MASRNKILKQVDRLAQRGNPAEAAVKLLQLVEENPRDVNLLNKAGDLYVRAGLIDDAVKQFDTIATFFKQDGFLLKAIAIYKKISKLDPARTVRREVAHDRGPGVIFGPQGSDELTGPLGFESYE